jgi:UDP-N-acetylglucosamine 2-epimerase (non-hydrolysing)
VRIAVCYGTRPEAIKLAPVVAELRRRGVEPTIIATGQHTSLLRGTPAESTMAPQIDVALPSHNDPMAYARACEVALRTSLANTKPDLVMVQGDTASAYAASSAAWIVGIPVAHVEAGIRSGDLKDPWPEEDFRVKIDRTAEWHFAPTEHAAGNLCAENSLRDRARDPQLAVTGNSGIDALYAHTQPSSDVEDRVLITLHRRESFGEPLRAIIQGLGAGAQKYPHLAFEWPIHPNPRVREAGYPKQPNFAVFGPMDTLSFARTLAQSRAVITDSGGVQEEAAALGIPCIVAREKTDRPESVEAGIAKVVGRTEQGILNGLDWALGFSTRPDPSTCFGDGHAAPRIVQHLLETA